MLYNDLFSDKHLYRNVELKEKTLLKRMLVFKYSKIDN